MLAPPPIPGTRPVEPAQRIASLDILRGLALFGVLLRNIQSFGLVTAAYENPFYIRDLANLDRYVWGIQNYLVGGRAMAIFSMLFGAGIILSTKRRDDAGVPSAGHFYRRYGILAGMGLLHAYLIWNGDILLMYSLCGFLVYLMRDLRAKTLGIIGGLTLLFSTFVLGMLMFLLMKLPGFAEEMQSAWWPDQQEIDAEVRAVLGSWTDWFLHNGSRAFWVHASMPFGLLEWTCGMMLMGMALQKSGFFTGMWTKKQYATGFLTGLIVGFVMTMPASTYVSMGAGYPPPAWRYSIDSWGGLFMGFGYMCGIMGYLSETRPGFILRAFGNAGRMALTLYLSQSVICGLIFNGYGFGYFEQLSYLGLAVVATGLFSLQVVFACLWFRKYQQGPIEAIWRKWAYK